MSERRWPGVPHARAPRLPGLVAGVRGRSRAVVPACDQLLGAAEDDAGEALAEAGEEGGDRVEVGVVAVRRLRHQEAAGEQEVEGDAEDRPDQRLEQPKPAQQRAADL